MKRVLKILTFTLLSLGLSALAYGVWLRHQDDQILQRIKVQRNEISRYRQETKLHPKDPQAYLKLGNAATALWKDSTKGTLISLKRGGVDAINAMNRIGENPLKEAAIAYGTALKLEPKLTDAQIGLCNVMVERKIQGQEATVTTTCRKAIDLKPQSVDSYLALGVALSRQTQWPEAEAMFRKYLSLTDNKGNAYYQIAKALLAQKKYDAAVDAYRQAIQFGSSGNLIYEGLGDALIEQDKPEEAIAAYRKSLEVEPEYPPVYIKLGDSLMQKQHFGEAITTYRQLIQRDPKGSSGYSGLGRALTAQQKWDEAIAAYNKAIELNDTDSWIFQDRGDMFAKQNKLNEAIADYNKAIQLEPSNIFALIHRGVAYARQGNPKSALVDFNRAVQLEPNSVAALNALCWNGSLMGYAAQVISACEKAITVANPQEKDLYRDSRGVAKTIMGNKQGAIADFQAFIQWTTSDRAKAYDDERNLQKRSAKRQIWIQDLQNHRNPFTPDLRQKLLAE
jgi:tetratricopeptide (TPR) repeat protein